jgi:hypothetical protein
MSGAADAIKALQMCASDAYRATHIAGSHYARANQGVAEADDIVKALAATVSLIVAAEDLHDAAELAVKSLRGMLAAQLLETGAVKVQTDYHSAYLSKKSAFLKISDESLVPREYFVQGPPSLDRAALKAAIQEGAEVPGVSLAVPNDMTLNIRPREAKP